MSGHRFAIEPAGAPGADGITSHTDRLRWDGPREPLRTYLYGGMAAALAPVLAAAQPDPFEVIDHLGPEVDRSFREIAAERARRGVKPGEPLLKLHLDNTHSEATRPDPVRLREGVGAHQAAAWQERLEALLREIDLDIHQQGIDTLAPHVYSELSDVLAAANAVPSGLAAKLAALEEP